MLSIVGLPESSTTDSLRSSRSPEPHLGHMCTPAGSSPLGKSPPHNRDIIRELGGLFMWLV